MRIGILGGGQLSRMLALAGIPLGFKFSFYFPTYQHALHELGHIYFGDYTDLAALRTFAEQVDVITFENENIPLATLDFLETLKPIHPNKNALKVSQDRLLEKNMFVELNIPTNRYFAINNQEDLNLAAKELGYPFILKTRTLGYDGKGQIKINNANELAQLNFADYTPALAEQFVNFQREVSLIAARNPQGQIVYYDICENVHHQGILFKTHNRKNDAIFSLAQTHLEKMLTALNYVGILTIEFFQVGQQLLANEMAPRVHNSGHWTIETCMTSQFENHLRCVSSHALGATCSLAASTLYNIISKFPEKNKLLALPGLRLHDYEKTAALKRKLGHITLLQSLSAEVLEELEQLLIF